MGSTFQNGGGSKTVVYRHDRYTVGETNGGLSILFTVLCIVDLFGVFPVVALPKSVIACGLYGLPLVVSVFGLQIYTAVLLGKSWLLAQEITPNIREKNRFPYAAVAELAFGVKARRVVTFLIDATVFGAGIPNFIFAAQSMQLFWWKITGGGVGISYCIWMLVIGLLLCPVMWLGSPKDMKPLALASVFVVATVAVCTWSCILLDDVSPISAADVIAFQPTVQDFLVAYGIIAFQTHSYRFPYAAVAELAFGVKARRVVTFLIDATVFGAGIPNFIFAAQSMQLFWWKITGGGVGISYCIWMLVIGLLLCPVMWLGSPKDMKPLALASVFVVATVAVCTWSCILLDDVSPISAADVIAFQPTVQDFLVAYGIIAFQFDIHPMLLTIQVDMKDSRRINMAVLGGFAITGAMFAVTSVLAANRYGRNVDSNILQGIPPSIALYVVALLVTLQLCLSSAVGNSALFQHIEDLLEIPREFCVQRCLIRSSIVVLAVFLGESVPRFDLVMGLVGSTLTGPLMFIFPPLFFLKLCYRKSNLRMEDNLKMHDKSYAYHSGRSNGTQNGYANEDLIKLPLIIRDALQTTYRTFSNEDVNLVDEYSIKWYDVLLAVIVMLMGVGATIVATYSSWSDAITSATFSPPCLTNITAAARSFLEA